MRQDSPQLDSADLNRQIMAALASYEGRSSFECFALIMGKAQILEFGLKSLLIRRCSVDPSETEKWTLGKVASGLEKRGFRDDFVAFLRDFIVHRNYIAHEMLANNAIYRSIATEISERFEFRQLQDPAYKLEHLLIVHDWLEEHDAWNYRVDA
jgi:hypothetical protein